MKRSTFIKAIEGMEELVIFQSNGTEVPRHFHITEAGMTTRHFIDCGGTVREEKVISMQVWVANDIDHRLTPKKLMGILDKAKSLFGGEDLDVEIEYQAETIGRFGIEILNNTFVLVPKFTDCLAKDTCGIPSEKPKIRLSTKNISSETVCIPGGGCC